MSAVLLTNTVATLFMTGLIWFVQVVHYPLFAKVGEAEFARFHDEHSRRVTWIVLPVMTVELATALALALAPPAGVSGWLAWVGLALAAGIWACTGLVQVWAHARLDRAGVDSLVARNWARTVLWSARAGVVVAMLALTT